MISLNKGSSRGSDAKMKKRKNDCLQNEVQDAKENHAVGEKKKYERKPSQPYCSTCGGNHFEACKGRFCKNCLKNERFIHLAASRKDGQMNKSLIFKVCSLSKWLQDRESVNFYRLPRESLLRTATYFILSLF